MYNQESKKNRQKEDNRSSHFRLGYKRDRGRGKVMVSKVVVTDRHFKRRISHERVIHVAEGGGHRGRGHV